MYLSNQMVLGGNVIIYYPTSISYSTYVAQILEIKVLPALTIILLYFFFSPNYQTLDTNYYTSICALENVFFSPNHAVRNTSLKYVTEFLSYLIVTIKCYTSFVCLSVCWLSLFLFFFFFFFFFLLCQW